MKNQLVIVLCLSAVLTLGCAHKWDLKVQPPAAQLVWPQPPEEPRVRYVMTIKGFREKGESLKGFFTGKGESLLVRPVAIAMGADGRIAIADTGSRSVHLFIPKEERYTEIVSLGAKKAMISPVSVAFDDELRLYVSDSSLEKIAVYDNKGKYLFAIGSKTEGVLKRPTGLAYDPAGKRLFAVDTESHKVHAFNTSGKHLFSFGLRGTAEGQFNFPTHIFLSSEGSLYVTDAMNYRIEIFDSSGKFKTLFGHHGDGSGDFAMPKGVAVDHNGTIYVVDSLFDNIQLFDKKGDFFLTVGSRGIGQAEFWLPSGIFIDRSDRLYVCDTYNHRIQVFDIISRNK